jgi:hypothetical protein
MFCVAHFVKFHFEKRDFDHFVLEGGQSLRVSICLNVVSIETLNLNTGKKQVLAVKKILTISKSLSRRSRSRNLNFILTPPSSPKSLDQDREICWDMKFLANLDSLSWSWSRVSQFYQSRFLNLSRFLSLKSLKKSQKCWDILINLQKSSQISKSQKSWFILTASMKILIQLNLDWKVLVLKISTERKNNLVFTLRTSCCTQRCLGFLVF